MRRTLWKLGFALGMFVAALISRSFVDATIGQVERVVREVEESRRVDRSVP